jgi:hypothetical protein
MMVESLGSCVASGSKINVWANGDLGSTSFTTWILNAGTWTWSSDAVTMTMENFGTKVLEEDDTEGSEPTLPALPTALSYSTTVTLAKEFVHTLDAATFTFTVTLGNLYGGFGSE